MRWILSAVVLSVVTSTAYADNFSFGLGFGRTYSPGYGYGGGYRHCGPHGHSHLGFGGAGLNIFGIARLNLYSSIYRPYGGSFTYYNGPAVPGYYYEPGFYYGPQIYTAPPAPILYGPNPPPFQANNPAMFEENDRLREELAGRRGPADEDLWEPLEPAEPVIRKSNAEAKRQSIRQQGFGDEWFARRDFRQALKRYRDAAAMAPDRSEPRLRMGIAYCAMGNPDLAAAEIRRSLKIDPNWPTREVSLEQLFGGPAGDVARNHMLLQLGDWVREDIRDPDRLFVLGTMLYLNQDPQQAMPFLKTAAQLSGTVAYLDPFLKRAQVIQPAQAEDPPEDVQPAVVPAVVPPVERRPQIVKPRNAPPKPDDPQVIEFPQLKAPSAVTEPEPTAEPSLEAEEPVELPPPPLPVPEADADLP